MRAACRSTVISVGIILFTLLSPPRTRAIEELITEEDISELLVHSHYGGPSRNAQERQWALLPQLGYGPDTGPVVGVKFTDRDVFTTGMTFDIDGTYAALNNQQSHTIKLLQPHLFGDRFLISLRGKYRFDPQREFFGIGNNTRGPAPASTNAYQDYFGTLTVGWRPVTHLALNFSADLRHVDIRRGHRRHDCGGLEPCPFTLDAFPDLPGVKGGKTNKLSVSLVWNDRDENSRPTRGWRVLLKACHTNKSLLSDFEFSWFAGDVGYLHPFFNKRLISGIRADGLWVEAPVGQVPYWELPDLGGSDSLRGFFPHRFVGKKRVLINAELRGLLTEFDFYQIWHVKLDGVVFGETGRVFASQNDIENEFHTTRSDIRLVNEFQYSYGGGLRIEMSEALVARLDAGFSDEEKGLFYLAFGQTF